MRRHLMVCALVLGSACTSTQKPAANGPGPSGPLKGGKAHVSVTGAVTASIDVPVDVNASQYRPAPGGIALFWRDGRNDLLSIGGQAFSGTRKTDPTLQLGFNVHKGGTLYFATSSKGECSITMLSGPGNVYGSFTCTRMRNGNRRFDAKGTFSAER